MANKATKLGHMTKFLNNDWLANKSKQRNITEQAERRVGLLRELKIEITETNPNFTSSIFHQILFIV